MDGLDDYPAGLFGNDVFDAGFVVVGAVDEAWDHWAKGFLVLWVGGRGQATHCSPVEGVVKADDLMLRAGGLPYLSHFPGEFYSSFIGLGARVANEDFGRFGHGARSACLLNHDLGEGTGPGVVVEV